MHHFGHTRSVREADHFLLTPETFVRAPLPGMHKATAIVHASPASGAAFTQYTAELEIGGSLGQAAAQRFLYVLEGELILSHAGEERRLRSERYAYIPAEDKPRVLAARASRVAVIEKPYQPLPGLKPPAFFVGEEQNIAPQPLQGDEALQVRTLIPDDPVFDFAVNTMTYQPGASLPMVEIHVMEHGLLMLAGGGIYRLGEKWYPVTAGDFIWMAPYCPQWFGALGKVPSKYLIYKDWNRHPLANYVPAR
ncbi:(S)-ureidoglycine aminohydrolase [candidate division KSB1 bacterium]|nr:(S)-ureidoglycine aminohydrolase [candidate division KSB1 bacterium]